MIKFDIWYSIFTIQDVEYIGNISFYPADCSYRGHLLGKDGSLIGDFFTRDSVALEKRFPGCFD